MGDDEEEKLESTIEEFIFLSIVKVGKKRYEGCIHTLKEFNHCQTFWIAGWFTIYENESSKVSGTNKQNENNIFRYW